MNVVFTLPTPELEAEFLEGAKQRNMVGLKGTVGRWHARVDLQRGALGVGARAVRVHGRIPQGGMMARVLVSDSLSKEGLEVLAKAEGIEHDYKPGLSEDDLVAAIPGYDGLIIRSGSKVTARVIAAADRLRVIGRAGIGVDNVDKEAASRRGIIVMNTPTGNAVTTAEHALSLLFAVARKIGMADATMKQGIWEKKKLQGRELTGKTLGVVGLGNIGRIVADRALGLKMKVIGYDPVVTPERAAELGVALVTLEELLSSADAITFHTPLTPETKGLVNDTNIAR
jgi:D-3-phosphoglycerate dehydrogenase